MIRFGLAFAAVPTVALVAYSVGIRRGREAERREVERLARRFR